MPFGDPHRGQTKHRTCDVGPPEVLDPNHAGLTKTFQGRPPGVPGPVRAPPLPTRGPARFRPAVVAFWVPSLHWPARPGARLKPSLAYRCPAPSPGPQFVRGPLAVVRRGPREAGGPPGAPTSARLARRIVRLPIREGRFFYEPGPCLLNEVDNDHGRLLRRPGPRTARVAGPGARTTRFSRDQLTLRSTWTCIPDVPVPGHRPNVVEENIPRPALADRYGNLVNAGNWLQTEAEKVAEKIPPGTTCGPGNRNRPAWTPPGVPTQSPTTEDRWRQNRRGSTPGEGLCPGKARAVAWPRVYYYLLRTVGRFKPWPARPTSIHIGVERSGRVTSGRPLFTFESAERTCTPPV